MSITIKSKEEIKKMRKASKILAQVIKKVQQKVAPKINTKELNKVAEDFIFKLGGRPSFKGYQGFPASLCTSINEEVVHAVPSNRVLKEGDVLSLDLGVFYKGFHADMAVTVPVGEVTHEANRLIRVTKKSLKRGIKKVKPGRTIGDIGNSIQRYVEGRGFNVVRDLCGHGIGKNLHEDPKIPNYGRRKSGDKIKSGMVLCLEPMVVMGDWALSRTKDGFGYKTRDNSLAAHFEHTIAVTTKGAEVLTKV